MTQPRPDDQPAQVRDLVTQLRTQLTALAGTIAVLDATTENEGEGNPRVGLYRIGHAELERLRATLGHPDADKLTAWEVVEFAADAAEARSRQRADAGRVMQGGDR